MRKFVVLIIALTVLSFSVSACGKKARPIPPKDFQTEETKAITE